jgi:hypothetical protein
MTTPAPCRPLSGTRSSIARLRRHEGAGLFCHGGDLRVSVARLDYSSVLPLG